MRRTTIGLALAVMILWGPAALARGGGYVGFGIGGELGARAALVGGERLIKPVLVLAVIALAGRMLGLY